MKYYDENSYDRPRVGRNREPKKSRSTVIILVTVGCGIALLTIVVLVISVKRGTTARKDEENKDEEKKAFVKRPRGARIDDDGRMREHSEVVDESWPKLVGKWEILPNPMSKGSAEFRDDYTYTHWFAVNGQKEHRAKKTVVAITDRSFFYNITERIWLTIGPNDRHYELTYETQPNVYESGTVTIFANDTIGLGADEHRYYRVAGPEQQTQGMRSLEETLWVLMAGRRWSMDYFERSEVIEFHQDKTIYWKRTIKQSTATVQGKITAIQATPTGFSVQLGKHTVNGEARASGTFGEFYYLGKYFYVKLKGDQDYSSLTPKAMN